MLMRRHYKTKDDRMKRRCADGTPLKNLPTDKGMFFPELDNDTFRMPLTSPLLFRATRGIHRELSMEDLFVSLTKCVRSDDYG
ncbi:hypothetical protein TNIN_455741 [Trichonephila inaurata madagascariensis]|uniref:Uncharacterized protein n=1 Tax=Trichonephila inaurata madagascariensis TaxID=2747483 RepID=A0A8X7BRL0_9ARAC|nr:hypothetical protein TNIN_455741 [Trichonephila inaurata madagascariensis]